MVELGDSFERLADADMLEVSVEGRQREARLAALVAELAEILVVTSDDRLLDHLHRSRLVEDERDVKDAVTRWAGFPFSCAFGMLVLSCSLSHFGCSGCRFERVMEEPKLLGRHPFSVFDLADVCL